MTNDPAASLHPPRRAALRSTRTPPASDLHFLTAGPLARRRKRSPNAPDSTRRPIPAPPPRCCTPPGPTPAYTRHEEQAGTARARTTKTPPSTAQASRHGVLRTPVVPSLSNVAPEMAEPPKTSEQRIDAAVQLLRPRGPWTRGRSTGRGGVLSSQQKVLKQTARRVSALMILWCPLSPTVAPEMAEPPKTSEQRIDAAVQLLRPRGPGARGRSAGRAGCSHRTEGLAAREPQAPTSTPNHAQPSVKPPRADSPPQAEMLRCAAPTHPSAPPPWLLPPALR